MIYFSSFEVFINLQIKKAVSPGFAVAGLVGGSNPG